MPLYQIQAPNGKTYQIEGPEGASQQQIINAVLAQHPEAGKAPEEPGVIGRALRGAESIGSSQLTGIQSLYDEKFAEKALARQEDIQRRYPGQSDWEAVKAKYEKSGFLPAVGEYFSRVPGALAEQTPLMAENIAAAAAGAATPIPGAAEVGFVTPSYLTAYGTLLEREAEEQKKRGEAVDPSRLKAAALAVPYTAVDIAARYIPMGRGLVKSMFGDDVANMLFRGATKEAEQLAAQKLAKEGLGRTLLTGTAKGAAFEIPGEVSQQVIERFNAGLPLLDDDALKEYGETAFSTSMLAPFGAAGRISERSGARNLLEQQRQEADAKQRAEAAKAEELRKNSPEYIKEFAQTYEEAEAQFKGMRDVVKKPGEDATPAERAKYKEDKEALDELGRSLYAGSTEYRRVKPLYEKLKEDERFNALTPEERMLESLGIKQPTPVEEAPAAKTPRYVIDEMGRVVEASEAEKAKEEKTPELLYAEKQLQQASDFGQFMLDDKVAWLMDNPAMAKLLVDNNVEIPGVSPKESKAILSALRLQLKESEKQRSKAAAERGAEETELTKKQLPGVEEEPSTAFDEIVGFAQESKAQSDEELRHLDDKFVEGLSNPDTSALTVSMAPVGGSAKKPAQIRDRVEAAFQEADKADAEYLAARAARSPEAALAAKNRATAAVQKLNALAETGGDYTKELIKLRRAQITAWGKLTDAINSLRSQETLDSPDPEKRKTAASTTATLQKQAARARSDLITSILQEAATNRRASWQQLSKDEAIKGADRIRGLVDTWMERATTEFQPAEYEEVTIPAQMRANKIVRPATTERRLIKAPVSGLSKQESLHFISSIRGVIRDLMSVPKGKVTKETPLMQQQFAETEKKRIEEERGETKAGKPGELTRLREYVGDKLAKALGKTNIDKNLRTDLEAAQDIIEDGTASKNLLDIVDHIAERINTGRTEGLKTKFEQDPTKPGRVREVKYIGETKQNIQELKDALRLTREVKEDTSGQKQLDLLVEEPGERPRLVAKDLGYIRMTPENFANSPKVKAAREAADKLRAVLARAEKKNKREAKQRQKLEETIAQLEDAKTTIANLKANTKFFNAKDEQWPARTIAELAVPYPTADKKGMEYMAAIEKRKELVAQVMSVLGQGKRIDGINSKLINMMQDKNEQVRNDAAKLKEELKPWLDFIQRLEKELKAKVKLTPEEKKITGLLKKLDLARSKYERLFGEVFHGHMADMDAALADLLDPSIKEAETALSTAETNLEKETDELGRLKDRLDALTKTAKSKTDVHWVLYDQFQYEEKLGVIKALEKDIADLRKSLEELYDDRSTDMEMAAVGAKAALDKHVQAQRDKVIALEKQIAALRGEDITEVRGGVPQYPFSLQQKESKDLPAVVRGESIAGTKDPELRQAIATLKGAENLQRKTEERIKTAQEQMEEAWKTTFGGTGRRRIVGRSTFALVAGADEKIAAAQETIRALQAKAVSRNKPLGKRDQTTLKTAQKTVEEETAKRARLLSNVEEFDAQSELDKKLKAEEDARDRAYDAQVSKEMADMYRAQQLAEIDSAIAQDLLELEAFDELPDGETDLRNLINDENTTTVVRNRSIAKIAIINSLTALDAQRDVLQEGATPRKPRVATTASTSAQAAKTPLRAGIDYEADIRAETQAANEAAKQALGKKAPKLSERAVKLSNDLRAGIIQDDFEFSRGTPTKESAHTVKTLMVELEKSLGQGLFNRGEERMVSKKLDIYESPEQFMQANTEYAMLIPLDAKGFVHEGRAVLFANNIGKGHGLGVLLHEVGVHIGFKNFFNISQYHRLVKTVKNWAARTDDSVEAAVGKAAMARVKAAATPEAQVNDELLAYAVEEAMRMGVEPAGVKGGTAIANWLKILVDAFRSALKAFGINPKNLTAGDLVNMAYGAAHLELNGTWHGSGAFFKEFDHEYMGTGENRQAYGWGNYRAQTKGTARNYEDNEHSKNVRRWASRPEIKNWSGSQSIKVGGVSFRDVQQILDGEKQNTSPFTKKELEWLSDILPSTVFEEYDYEDPFQIIKDNIEDAQVRSALPPGRVLARPIGAPKKLSKIEKARLRPPSAIEKLRDAFYSDILRNKYNISAPTKRGLFQGKNILDLDYDKWNGVHTLQRYLIGDWSEQTFNQAKDAALKDIMASATYWSSYPDEGEMLEKYKKSWRFIKKIEFKDLSFERKTNPPIPRPVGIMHRMLSVAPEEHYLLWDKPWKDQSKYVQDAFEKLLNGIPKKSQKIVINYITSTRKPVGQDFYYGISTALSESGIPPEMCDMFASKALASEGIAGHKFYDGQSRNKGGGSYNYVDYMDKDEGPQVIATNIKPIGQDKTKLLFSRKAQYANDAMARLGKLVEPLISDQKPLTERVRAASGGFLGAETMLVDRFAPLERLSKVMDSLKGSQMMYYLRSYDQRMNVVAQAVAHGAPDVVEVTRKDGQVERLIEVKDGANIKQGVELLKAAKPYVGNAEAVNRMFTMYLSAIRAKSKGFDALHFGEAITEEQLQEVYNEIKNNKPLADIFEAARSQYNEYNRDQMRFLAKCGAISESEAKRLIANDDYIPWYRERDGVAQMVIGNETPVRIGSLQDMPYLKPLVGGDKPIMDFFTTSVQNTNMIVEMGLNNLATKTAIYNLMGIGAAKLTKKATGPNVIKFKEKGEERYAIVEGVEGIPGDLIVKGMMGIPTQFPLIVRALSLPANLLRKAITLSPAYMAKQLFKDSTGASIMSGANTIPVLSALKQINNPKSAQALTRRGITGGQVFTGSTEDMSMILREMADGKTPWVKGLAMLEALGREADALTRRSQYNSYIEQGLSEMEATLMSLESMNFTKRGASPSIHWANSLIPFMNAQIQGLNVLYKSFFGKMPFNERLKIQEKMLQRGALMMVTSLAYAAAMQDDEAYDNATPEQRAGNWFVRIPGLDEPLRIPVPFELGYVFKSMPEALYNTYKRERGGEEALKAFGSILLQTIPGGTSLGIPQALRVPIELTTNTSLYNFSDIVSKREQQLLPEEQYRDNTSALAKAMGSAAGVSPIKIDYAINAYFGQLGTAAVQAVSVPFSSGPEKAARRWSETPVIGGLFQPNDAGGILNQVYDDMLEVKKVHDTYKNLVKEGRVDEAIRLVDKRSNEFMLHQTSNWFINEISKLSQYERAIKAADMPADEKRKELDELRKMKIDIAKMVREASAETKRQ